MLERYLVYEYINTDVIYVSSVARSGDDVCVYISLCSDYMNGPL